MDRGDPSGLLTSGFCRKVDKKAPKSMEYQCFTDLEASHNPEVAGSNPVPATKKVRKIADFPNFFFVLGLKSLGEKWMERLDPYRDPYADRFGKHRIGRNGNFGRH